MLGSVEFDVKTFAGRRTHGHDRLRAICTTKHTFWPLDLKTGNRIAHSTTDILQSRAGYPHHLSVPSAPHPQLDVYIAASSKRYDTVALAHSGVFN